MLRFNRSAYIRPIFLVLFYCSCCLMVSGQSISLQGKIVNILGQPIPGVTIVIESDRYLLKQKTDAQGTYDCYAPKGIYRIYTESWTGKLSYQDSFYMPKDYDSYFRPAGRASITVSNDNPTTLNFVLIESAAVLTHFDSDPELLSGTMEKYFDAWPHPKVKYETLFPANPDIHLDFVIQYGFKREEKGKLVYLTIINLSQTSMFGKRFPGVVMTYDRTTIYAERVEFDRSKNVLKAEGNIVVEDGKNQLHYRKAKIVVKNDIPKFEFEK